jgi:hypothetical protein
VNVVVEIGTVAAATGLTSRAANVAAAVSTDAAGVVIARSADLETLSLLRLIVTLAEGQTRVWRRGPGGSQPQRGQHGTGENGPQPAQGFAARHRLGQRFGEFIEKMVHD